MVVRAVSFFSRRALLILLVAPFFSAAQFYSLPTDYEFNILTTRALAGNDTTCHPGMQPYIPLLNSNHNYVADTSVVFKYIKADAAIDFIFRNHFIQVKPKAEPFLLRIDPVLNFEVGREPTDPTKQRLYTNSRGFVAAGTIGSRFYFETMLCENQSFFPVYLENAALAAGIVPGEGRWKSFKVYGFDYAFATGLASIQLHKNINLQFGHGKHKIGHGYRSLLLSDNAFNYPFARITQQWLHGKLRYTNVYASLMNLVPAAQVVTPNTERLFQKKSAAFQYFEIQPHPAVSIGFFQGVIWKPGDSKNRQHLTWEYFNPVIYSQLVGAGLDDPEMNVLAGVDLIIKVSRSLNLYGQFMADHEDHGMGYQAGIKYFDVFGIRHLTAQAEYNYTGASAYTGTTSPTYSHYNQNLALTIANGSEQAYIVDYRNKRFLVNAKHHVQGLHDFKNANITTLKVGYLVNPRYNLQVCAGYMARRNLYVVSVPNPHTDYFYVSFRTSIYNKYHDF